MTEKVKDLLNKLLRAIEYEREEERALHLEEIKRLTGIQREQKGRALVGLVKKKVGRALGGDYLYAFSKRGVKYLPDTQISIGDQVILSQYSPLDVENPKGTVYDMSSREITISLANSLAMSNTIPIRMDLYVNDITYQRMETALSIAKSPQNSKLHALLSGYYNVNSHPQNHKNPSLNQMQNNAVNYALANNGYYSVQGPPGTGKTHTATYFINQIVARGQRVLITADSNAAVDNLIRKLVSLGHNPLRIGNPIRVNNDLKQYTLDYKVLQHALYGSYQKTVLQIEQLKQEQKQEERPSPRYTRGLKTEQLIEIISNGERQRGIEKEVIKRFKPWLKSQLKLDALYDKLKEIKKDIQAQLLLEHTLIASTNSTAGSDLLELERFDWVVIDEAAQASIPSSLISILKADRFVLFGDHFQLPPVIMSRDAVALGLNQSAMAYLAKLYPYQLTRLNLQYRMHRRISDLVSIMFYDGALIADDSIKERHFEFDNQIIKQIHITGKEHYFKDSKSLYNKAEMFAVKDEIEQLINKGITWQQIAVITPYKAQARLLAEKLAFKCEVDTVDAFQGREKDVVIISFVRSNEMGRIGFLKDYRRLNVSISRAKQMLILVGDFETLKSDILYKTLFETLQIIL